MDLAHICILSSHGNPRPHCPYATKVEFLSSLFSIRHPLARLTPGSNYYQPASSWVCLSRSQTSQRNNLASSTTCSIQLWEASVQAQSHRRDCTLSFLRPHTCSEIEVFTNVSSLCLSRSSVWRLIRTLIKAKNFLSKLNGFNVY